MLKNNIEVDVKVKCIEAGKTQAQLGEAIDTTAQSEFAGGKFREYYRLSWRKRRK